MGVSWHLDTIISKIHDINRGQVLKSMGNAISFMQTCKHVHSHVPAVIMWFCRYVKAFVCAHLQENTKKDIQGTGTSICFKKKGSQSLEEKKYALYAYISVLKYSL